MRIFVTGGTGFIGRFVVRELQSQGHKLLLLSRQSRSVSDADTILGGLSDIARWQKELKRLSPEAAIHLAWEGLPNYDVQTSLRNLNYGLNLITTLADIGCQSVICSGSCWEYGQQSGRLSEDTGLKPYNAFTAAKNSLHWLGREIARERGMRFIWTRLFYVYGPGQRETSLIPYIIDCARVGKKPEIKTPAARNDFIYVEDAARAFAAIVKKSQKDGVYNIGSGTATSVQEIVNIICGHFNFQDGCGSLVSNSQSGDIWADISRITEETGWRPETGTKEGIDRTIRALKEMSNGKDD